MKWQIDLLFVSYNGSRTLPAMLEGLAGQLPTRRPLRILAVNNGSTDATGQILADWPGRLPMRVLQGPGSGKVPALAQAAPELEGDLVVLTDDDILPEPGWLAELEAAADQHPEASIFGGAIEPFPIEATSGWYTASSDYEVDLFSKAEAPAGPVLGADTIFGPNMMLRLDAAKAGLSASTTLGPSPAVKNGKRVFPLGDESEMLSRLEAAGARAIFVPQAKVKHMVRGFRPISASCCNGPVIMAAALPCVPWAKGGTWRAEALLRHRLWRAPFGWRRAARWLTGRFRIGGCSMRCTV